MSRDRNRHSSFPEPDDERPSALSADGLTVGPLLGEDGEDMGTYPFAGPLSDAPPGQVTFERLRKTMARNASAANQNTREDLESS